MDSVNVNFKISLATADDRENAWDVIGSLLQTMADYEDQGYQIVALETMGNRHEEVLWECLPDGVDDYDPFNGHYSDGVVD